MSVNCPHCRDDIGKSKDPGEFPWEDGDYRILHCGSCGQNIWIIALSSIRWETFKSEEEMDLS